MTKVYQQSHFLLAKKDFKFAIFWQLFFILSLRGGSESESRNMRENKNIRIKCSKILLVPYEAYHVPKYHRWMESETLREQTASERLTLEEEYDMQKKWREDPDKCTFIVLNRELYERCCKGEATEREIDAMVGDVNIFYPPDAQDRVEGEVEIMIAEESARGKGFGKEAVCSMIRYAHEVLKTMKFTSKIGCENHTSIHLFSSLGFKEVSRSDVFQEVTLSLNVTDTDIYLQWTNDYSLEAINK